MMAILAFNELMSIASEALNIWILILKNLFARYVFISSLYEVERHFPFCHMIRLHHGCSPSRLPWSHHLTEKTKFSSSRITQVTSHKADGIGLNLRSASEYTVATDLKQDHKKMFK